MTAISSGSNGPHALAMPSAQDEPAAQRDANSARPRYAPGTDVFPLIAGRLSFAAHTSVGVTHAEIAQFPERFYFSSNYQERYAPFCLDFGPVNLAVVHKFCGFMRKFWRHEQLQDREMVYYTADTFEHRTNAAFLLAAFMVVDQGYSPEDAWAPFAQMPKGIFSTFRDATFCEQKYGLTVLACLQGLKKALSLGWYNRKAFSAEDYQWLETSEAGDMHMVSPKFIAFKGPVDPSATPTDDVVDEYAKPPEHYASMFQGMGVSGVVRLNEASTYDNKAFRKEGINHHDIYFDDCTMPDRTTVRAFLAAVEKEEGVVAVHCRAGLGRTGTLIAVYLMEHHGFTAAEAIGWLRVVRPGSVIGDQQHFLHWYEGTEGGSVKSSLASADLFQFLRTSSGGDASLHDASALGKMVAQAQINRAERREGAAMPPSPPGSPAVTRAPTPTKPTALSSIDKAKESAAARAAAVGKAQAKKEVRFSLDALPNKPGDKHPKHLGAFSILCEFSRHLGMGAGHGPDIAA